MAIPSVVDVRTGPAVTPAEDLPVTQANPPIVAPGAAPRVPRSFMGDARPGSVDPRSALTPTVRVAQATTVVSDASPAAPAPRDEGFLGPVWGFFNPPPPSPLLRDKKRLIASYGGIDTLVQTFAPEQRQQYNRLLAQTDSATEPAQLVAFEQRLRDLKTRVMDSARAAISAEQARVEAAGGTFDRLAYLQQRGWVAASWRMAAPNRAVRDSVPSDGAEEQRAGLYNRRVPVEAELILDTRLPIAAVDRNNMGVTVVRGEDYGSHVGLEQAQQLLAQRNHELTTARAAEQQVNRSITQGAADVQAARMRIDQARAAVARATSQAELAQREVERLTALATQADTAARDAETQRASAAARIASDLLNLDRGIDMSILFETGRATLRPESIRQLQELGTALRSESLSGLPIVVDGHTDASGSPERNQVLSEQRAAAVVDYLVNQLGVPRTMLTSRGMGQRDPKDPANPLADVNRRVQIAIDITPQRRAELQLRANEAQLAVDTRAAELARASVDASANAVNASDRFSAASTAVTDARGAFDRAQADYIAATARLREAQAALPAATAAVTTATSNVTASQRSVERETPLAEGALFVNDFRGNHFWFEGQPERLPERIAEALTRGFTNGGGEEASAARELLRRRNTTTGNTLALDIGTVLAQTENDKSGWTVLGERFGDMFKGMQGRWVTINGYSGRGEYVTASQQVPDTVTPPREQIVEVELISPDMLPPSPVLARDAAVATGPAGPQDVVPGDNATAPAAAADPALAPLSSPDSTLTPVNAENAADALAEAARRRAEEAQRNLEQLRAGMDQQRAAAQTPGPVTAPARSPRIELALNFARDSAVITDASALRALGPQLLSEQFRGQRIFINGHTDDTGSAAHNLDLSRRRAQAVRDYLIANFNIPAEILVVQGFGATRLKNSSDPQASENRRVEVVVGVQ